MDADALDEHYWEIVQEMAEGRVVPLLGAGVNLCGRSEKTDWKRDGSSFLPSGGELGGFLARYFRYPEGETPDLLRISQYAKVRRGGNGVLYKELREIFDTDYEPTAVHTFLAGLPKILKSKGCEAPHQLILTTNYDDSLERAFQEAKEPFDLVSYIAEGEHRGKFLHRPPEGQGEPRLAAPANGYTGLSLEKRTVILKIHGHVERPETEWGDSYVITQDDYIDYLTRTDIGEMVPVTLLERLRGSGFLFLGYGLQDWNLLVILHRIWGAQTLKFKSWAIQVGSSRVDRELWRDRNVEILDVELHEYVAGLDAHLQEPFGPGVVP